MMKTKSFLQTIHPTGLALALTSGIIYLVCTIVFVLWPVQSLLLLNLWFHGVGWPVTTSITVTWSDAILGLVLTVISAYLIGLLFTWLYQKCKAHCEKY